MPAKDIYHDTVKNEFQVIVKMDSLTHEYRQIIEKILQEYADFLDNDRQVQVELIFLEA